MAGKAKKKRKGGAGRPRTTGTRVEELKVRLLHGVSEHFLRIYAEKRWGVKYSQARRYIAHARKLIEIESIPYTKDLFLEHMVIRRELREQAYKAKDLKLVLEIVKDEATLLNFYEARKMAATAPDATSSIPEVTTVLLTPPAQSMTAPVVAEVPSLTAPVSDTPPSPTQ